MDDRFDFQLVTGELLDGEGLSYIGPTVPDLLMLPLEESYHAFGNDGSQDLNGNISTGSGATPVVLAALETASDHLPVVADYQLPARMFVEVAPIPPRLIVGSSVALDLSVENTAPVVAVMGADELDYTVRGTGAVSGSLAAVDDPLGGGNSHSLMLDTSTLGHAFGTLEVVSDSQQVANGTFLRELSYEVLEHSEASFETHSGVDSWTIDFGTVLSTGPVGFQSIPIRIHNVGGTSEFTADLVVETADGTGDITELTIDFVPTRIPPGEFAEFRATLDTSQLGGFVATWTISTRDEQLPGATAGNDLLLELIGSVIPDLSELQGGDADMDLDFDQLDIVLILLAGKYLTGKAATWGEGDWTGDGLFDQRDIVAALATGSYLSGPYATSNLGTSAASEPTSCLLAFAGVVCLTGHRWRRQESMPPFFLRELSDLL
jgi:hypothetical protein